MNATTYVWLAVAVVLTAGSFFAGRALRPEQAPAFAYERETPAYEAAPPLAASSRGGFTGFGEIAGFDGATVLGGEVVSIAGSQLTLRTPAGSESVIRVTGDGPLRRIEAATAAALRPGVTVVVRTGAAGQNAEAVLIVAQP